MKTASRILGILVLIAGVVMLFYSNYIYDQLGEGRAKVASAQGKVDMTNQLFSLTPESKKYGKEFVTSPIQEKINEGRMTIEQYEILADRLHLWGIILIVVGALIFIASFFLRKKSRR